MIFLGTMQKIPKGVAFPSLGLFPVQHDLPQSALSNRLDPADNREEVFVHD